MADASNRGSGKQRLARYRAKRDFQITAEPSDQSRSTKGQKLIFVVQKHAATRLHWDFRLEWQGTLRSWAVPKGPSLDPADKRLAVEVEDHPLAYAKFEGDIPKGQYGGGHVDIWDEGTWQPLADFKRGLAKGRLEFEMFGRKLRGRWHLVRTRMQGKQPQWLLIKSHDDAARAGATADVIDALGAREPAALTQRAPKSRAAPKARRAPKPRGPKTRGTRGKALPATLKPQLATLVDAVPEGDWVYELKYDGIRLLSRVDGEDVRCISRNGLDWTRKVPPIVTALGALELSGAWLDGELIVTDPNGRSDFSLLQHVLEQKRFSELQLCLFDALYLEGEDLRALPLAKRKARLDAALAKLPQDGVIRLADQIQSESAELLRRVCNNQLEGLIAKRVDSPYTGDRSPDWLKVKCRREQEFVVGGAAYIASRGTGAWSSLLVGVQGRERVKYCGRVGGGFSAAERRQWQQRIEELEVKQSPFDRLPEKRPGEKWRWMSPKLVIQVAFQDWTQDGILRQPRFLGLREDRDPKTVVREEPAHMSDVVKDRKPARKSRARKKSETQAEQPRLTHPERVLFPQDGITKLQLAEYFAAVGEAAMPHYENRPLSILRNAHGATPFFQKHFIEKSSAGLRVVKIPNADKDPDFAVCESPEGLLHLAQVGAVELHSWGARMPRPTHADRLTFDLDPGEGVPYSGLREAALAIRKLLEDLELESWVKTTGGKGLHVVVPLTRPLPDWPKAKDFAHEVTLFMERLAPDRFASKTGERNRKGKIFVDYLRNGFGATAVAAFSPRWRPGVGVSTPVAWEEIDDDLRGAHFNIHNVPKRVAQQRKDPWAAYWKCQQSLTKTAIRRLGAM